MSEYRFQVRILLTYQQEQCANTETLVYLAKRIDILGHLIIVNLPERDDRKRARTEYYPDDLSLLFWRPVSSQVDYDE